MGVPKVIFKETAMILPRDGHFQPFLIQKRTFHLKLRHSSGHPERMRHVFIVNCLLLL